MKSQGHVLLSVALGLCKDVQVAYPRYGGCSRDSARIASSFENRGLGFFTLDLPNLSSILLDGLENGRLSCKGPCSRMVSKHVKVPKLFSGLWLRVFDRSGCLLSEPDVTSIAFLYQLSSVGKKVEVPCSSDRIKDAIGEYHDIERNTRAPSLRWDEDELDPDRIGHSLHFCDGLASRSSVFFGQTTSQPEPTGIRRLLGNLSYVCSKVSASFGHLDPYAFSEDVGDRRGSVAGLKHGPGAVSDLGKNDFKYSFPNWPDKLQQYFPFDAFGVLNHNHFEERTYPHNHEPPSKLICVPKTAKGPRLIASEPTCHQWAQQLVARYVTDSIDRTFKGDFITIRDQDPSRRMVTAASLSGDLATVDLSSASDRLSCWLVERAFRGNLSMLRLLHSVRTRWTLDTISDEKNFLKLRKFSTQGSALTFPIQSIVFLCCVLAVLPRERSLNDYRKKWAGKVRVFGDDIILPKAGYADLVVLLHYLGLKVNMNKSFHKGFFRESCGMDSYKGYDITPVKTKTARSDTPTACASMIDYSNNLFLKGYWHASVAAESALPKRIVKNLAVVGPAVGPTGRISFCGSRTDHLKSRYSLHLHRTEVLVVSFMDTSRRKSPGGYGAIFQYCTEAPDPTTKWVSGVAPRSKTREGLRWVALQDYSVNSPRLSA